MVQAASQALNQWDVTKSKQGRNRDLSDSGHFRKEIWQNSLQTETLAHPRFPERM